VNIIILENASTACHASMTILKSVKNVEENTSKNHNNN